MHSLFILGRQPGIGRAELESLLGADHIHPLSASVVLSDAAPESIDFKRLGGSIKLAEQIGVISKPNMPSLHLSLEKLVLERA